MKGQKTQTRTSPGETGLGSPLTLTLRLESPVVLLRIQGLGFKDPTLRPFLAGERKSGSSRQGFQSLLPDKKAPKIV
jgi:hypothetical protein